MWQYHEIFYMALSQAALNLLKRSDLIYLTSESDVYRRQILTYKDDPRTERIKIFTMAVDPSHRSSNKAERAN